MADTSIKLAHFPARDMRRIGVVAGLAIGMTLAAYLLAGRIGGLEPATYLETAGYLGLFVITLVSNATVIVPVPGIAAVFIAGKLLNPVLVGLVAGAGMTIGELSGYLLGTAGREMAVSGSGLAARALNWIEGRMARHGPLIIFVLALVPNPFFDLAGLSAGASRMRLPIFIAATFVGKTLRCLAIALTAAAVLPTV